MADDRRTKKKRDDGPKEDLALVWGATSDGNTLGVLRKRGDEVEPALVTKAVEGQPIHGELIRLSPRDEPLLFDVDVLYEPEASQDSSGPAQVASDAYRRGWDRLFKRRKRALN